jgi:hypothetical protein
MNHSNKGLSREADPPGVEVFVDGSRLNVIEQPGGPMLAELSDGKVHELCVWSSGRKIITVNIARGQGGGKPADNISRLNAGQSDEHLQKNSPAKTGFGEYSRPTTQHGHLSSSAVGSSNSSSRNAKPKAPDGFTPLFNGTDLTGWEDSSGGRHRWRVEEGAIVGSGPVPSCFLQCKQSLPQNFHLYVETILSDNDNSSIDFGPYRAMVGGTTPGGKWQTGDLAMGPQLLRKAAEARLKPNEWFTQEAVVLGNHITILVNGKPVTDYEATTLQTANYSLNLMCRGGSLVRYRVVAVKELPVADALPQGSVWKGTITYRKGAWVGATVRYEIHIRESDGKHFKGLRFDKGRNRGDVEGEVKGGTITWRENVHGADVSITVEGKLAGDTIHLTFKRSYGNGARVEGDGELHRDGP